MNRLISLDFFRGMTVALMIIVNVPGSWSHVYPPLLHAKWHGVTPTDLVFPFFLFIVGVSISLAYSKMKQAGPIDNSAYVKIIKRTIIIFMIGIFLALFPKFDFANLRVAGVLQRIALVFGVCAVLYLKTDWRMQLKIGVACLVGYFLAMMFIPVPGVGMGQLEPGANVATWVDSYLLPGRMYQKTWDPEGVFSTIPAIGTGITGMLVGHILLTKQLSQNKKIIWIFAAGFSTFVLGNIWSWFFPLNKHLWTSSYVLFTSGLAAMFFAASIWFIDELGYKKYTKLGVIFGMNAMAAYVLHGLLNRVFTITDPSIQSLYMDGLMSIGFPAKFASLSWAIGYMLLCFLFAYVLYRKKIYIKV